MAMKHFALYRSCNRELICTFAHLEWASASFHGPVLCFGSSGWPMSATTTPSAVTLASRPSWPTISITRKWRSRQRPSHTEHQADCTIIQDLLLLSNEETVQLIKSHPKPPSYWFLFFSAYCVDKRSAAPQLFNLCLLVINQCRKFLATMSKSTKRQENSMTTTIIKKEDKKYKKNKWQPHRRVPVWKNNNPNWRYFIFLP